jgi:hypothetical protein
MSLPNKRTEGVLSVRLLWRLTNAYCHSMAQDNQVKKLNLAPQETLIMTNSLPGIHNRISLTNKRLVFEEGNGYFSISWKQYYQLLLSNIEEASVNADSGIMDSITIKLKDGIIMRVQFKLADSHNLYLSPEIDQFASTPERWAQAINERAGKCLLIA